MYASLRGRLRQAGLFVVLLTIVLASAPGGRTAAQESGMRWDGLIELISGRYTYAPPTIDPPTPADGASTMSRRGISSDGRYILFNSDASNLGMGYPAQALYLRDRRTSETRILLAGPALNGTLSADGNHAAFEICDPYGRPQPRPDGAAICDVYALNLQTWAWTLISALPDDTVGDDHSTAPVLSGNGRFVVFRTKAGNLSGGLPGISHLVLRDRDADGNGIFDEPGTALLETVSAGGPSGVQPGNQDSDTAEVSDDGQLVAFRSLADNLVPGDHNLAWDVFVRDRPARRTLRINLRGGVEESAFSIDSPQISMTPDGRYIAYASADPMLAPAIADDVNGVLDVYVHDRWAGTTSRVDVGLGPPFGGFLTPGNGPTAWPTLSADGRYVSLQSSATNVQSPPQPGSTHAYVVDRVLQTATRVSVRPDSVDPDRDAVRPSISGDGSVVTFFSQALNLSPQVATEVDRIYAAVHLSLTPAEVLVPGSGGLATFTVTTQQHTQWWLDWTEWAPWWQLEAPPVSTGVGEIRFRINDPNPDPTRRSYTVRVHAKTALLTQLEGMSLTSVSPAFGPATGGTQVTITGTGFEPGVRVVFDGYEAAAEFVDSTTVIATAPPHAPGTVWVATFSSDYRQNAWIDAAFQYRDVTPPQIFPSATGVEGGGGWFVGDVSVSFGWWDEETPVTSTSGCGSVTVSADTPGTTFTCSATSEGGTGSGSITVRRDTAPPAIAVAEPRVRQLYEQGEAASSAFSCSDALSGVAQCGITAPSGTPLDTSTPGWHFLTADAADVAGNVGATLTEYAVSTDVCVAGLPEMKAWWRMEGNTRNTRSNITSEAIRVGLTGDVYVAAVTGQGYEFEGTDGYLNTNFGFRIPGDLRFSLAAWIKPSANTYGTILRKKDQYSIARTSAGTLAWAFRKFNNPTLTYVNTGVPLPLGAWSHAVVVLEGTEVRTYLNGRLAHTATNIGDVYTWDGMYDPITIGGAQDRGEYFKGVLDELQIFEDVLGVGQIDELFLSGPAGACPPKATQFFWTAPIQATYGAATYRVELALRDTDGQPVVQRPVHLESIVGAPPYSTSTADRVTDANGHVYWDAPLKNAPPGSYPDFLSATFAGDDQYVRAYVEPAVIVNKATPVLTWAAPPPITYGTPLGSAQLNATADVAGTFSYSPASGTVLGAATHDLVATFTPSNTSYYNTATASVALTVNKAAPTVTVTGGTFVYDGQAHPAAGTARGIGGVDLGSLSFTYNGSADPPVMAGTYEAIGTFAGDANYDSATGTATITITKGAPVLSWNAPGAIVYGTPLGAAQLNATASIPGTFTYTPAAGTVLDAGTARTLAAQFTPADSANYDNGSVSTTIDVAKASATVTVTGGTYTYDGQPHPATGSVTGAGGATLGPLTFTYNGQPDPPVNAGTFNAIGSFAGDANHDPAAATATIVIGKAAPVLGWSAPAPIVYGTPLGAAQLAATSSVAGSFTYTPAAGTVLPTGSHGLSATFLPADPLNYASGSVAATIAVTPALLTVRANDAIKPFGAPLPVLGAAFAGFVNGDTPSNLAGTIVVATSATQLSPVGAYSIVPAGVSSPNYSIVFVNGTLSIVKGGVGVAVASSPSPSGSGQPMTFTAVVSAAAPAAGAPEGAVQFFDGGTLLGTATLAGGMASLTTAGLPAGSHSIEARYLGDASFEIGSGVTPHVINDAASTPAVTLASSRNPSNAGQSVTLTANVSMSSGAVAGSVEFRDGAALLGTSTITNGRATLSISSLANGSHAITARYPGSAAAPPAISGVLVQTVGSSGWRNRGSSASLVTSENPATVGGSVTLTATVVGAWQAAPTGRVLFMMNGAVIGDPAGEPVELVSGTTVRAVLPLAALPYGSHTIRATYLGDTNYKGSTATLTQSVN